MSKKVIYIQTLSRTHVNYTYNYLQSVLDPKTSFEDYSGLFPQSIDSVGLMRPHILIEAAPYKY